LSSAQTTTRFENRLSVPRIRDYAFIVPIARRLYAPEAMPEILADLARGAEQGRHISTSRNQAKVPPAFMDLHNDLALRTL
jgi:hypothetical protein